MKLERGEELFTALYNICDFMPTEDHMNIIVEAVEKDNEENLSADEVVAKYWHDRCKKAEAYINQSPITPCPTASQVQAWSDYQDFIND